ncbi:MAG: hypothetical protein QOI37_1365, partial [Chloroflexota bacterium]|nr:hypothetical protein [Chloroflexota bacterium]
MSTRQRFVTDPEPARAHEPSPRRRLLRGSRQVACAWALLVTSILAGCSATVPSAGTGGPSAVRAAPAAPSAAAASRSNGPSNVPSASAHAAPSTFTSATYGYSVVLRAGWSSGPATARWDGVSGIKSDSPEVDRWMSAAAASAWVSAAPYAKDLPSYTAKTIADTVKYHGDTCSPPPAGQEPIVVGGEPGTLISWNCGILINLAVTV